MGDGRRGGNFRSATGVYDLVADGGHGGSLRGIGIDVGISVVDLRINVPQGVGVSDIPAECLKSGHILQEGGRTGYIGVGDVR